VGGREALNRSSKYALKHYLTFGHLRQFLFGTKNREFRLDGEHLKGWRVEEALKYGQKREAGLEDSSVGIWPRMGRASSQFGSKICMRAFQRSLLEKNGMKTQQMRGNGQISQILRGFFEVLVL
jgi:hypothetical protein